MKVVAKYKSEFLQSLQRANFVNIAVALCNHSMAREVELNLKDDARVTIILGYDLPTDPKAFKKFKNTQKNIDLFKIHQRGNKSFHPKFYMFSKDGNVWDAYVGSGNLTNGGMSSNYELGLIVRGITKQHELFHYWEALLNDNYCNEVDQQFITCYTNTFELLKERRKNLKAAEKHLTESLREDINIQVQSEKELIDAIDKSTQRLDDKEKEKRKKEVDILIKLLKEGSKEDLESFLQIKTLGNLTHRNKLDLDYSFPILIEILRSEDSIPKQYAKLMQLKGVGINLITKCLCVLHPQKYFVLNGVSRKVLRMYGYNISIKPSFEKYKELNNLVKSLLGRTKPKDMIEMDHALYHMDDKKFDRPQFWSDLGDLMVSQSDYDKFNPPKRKNTHHHFFKNTKTYKLSLQVNKPSTMYLGIDFIEQPDTEMGNFLQKYPLKDLAKKIELDEHCIKINPNEKNKQNIIQFHYEPIHLQDESCWGIYFRWVLEKLKILHDMMD